MKVSVISLAALVGVAAAGAIPIRAANSSSNLATFVPEFGVTQGNQPDGKGNCLGANGVKIPCNCPPARDAFLAQLNKNVKAGLAFPTDNSKGSSCIRANSLVKTVQDLKCPVAATPNVSTLQKQNCG
ncbi:hypothetical protein JX265_010157 [Neoarthrinium moseri]|uniref:Uncharacterized protein n=1 Tax=Neoarthrinium moseri TaxID=1658444 RepID=A0A9Q0AL36_9PEZI|nr:hypothetical protein JX266_012542 [Neoarthrinium moseri]KAI1860233.1 hypothetical protein JX265_010157 [Neoarthrinium moseri]